MAVSLATNIAAFRSARQLAVVDELLNTSTLRLSTNLRINSAQDDPSGVVQVNKLSGQIAGLTQAATNAQNANNVLAVLTNTGTGALQSIINQITAIQAAIVAPDQAAIDAALDAINSVANTTAFGDRSLLNGSSAFALSAVHPAVTNLKVFRGEMDSTSRTVNAAITFIGGTGRLDFGDAVGPMTIDITGPLGTLTLAMAGGDTEDTIRDFINANSGSLGLISPLAGRIETITFGSSQTISLRRVSSTGGSFTGGPSSAGVAAVTFPTADGQTVTQTGTDSTGTVEGSAFTADGRFVTFATPQFRGTFEVDENLASGPVGAPAVSFVIGSTVGDGPLSFKFGASGTLADRILLGLPLMTASTLGRNDRVSGTLRIGGSLATLRTGSENSLASNATNAARIATEALSQVQSLQSYLGAVQARVLTPAVTLNNTLVTELTNARSDIRDLNTAAETAEFTRLTLMFQSVTSVLAQANARPSVVAQLLSVSASAGAFRF